MNRSVGLPARRVSTFRGTYICRTPDAEIFSGRDVPARISTRAFIKVAELGDTTCLNHGRKRQQGNDERLERCNFHGVSMIFGNENCKHLFQNGQVKRK